MGNSRNNPRIPSGMYDAWWGMLSRAEARDVRVRTGGEPHPRNSQRVSLRLGYEIHVMQ
jgi:hypothetical protein